jgi:hypothetical protein
VLTGVWWRNLREGGHFEDLEGDGRSILRWIFKKWNRGGRDWIDLAQDKYRWGALVNAAQNFQVA